MPWSGVWVFLPWVHSLWSAVGLFPDLLETAWHPGGSPALPGSCSKGMGNICFPFFQESTKGT